MNFNRDDIVNILKNGTHTVSFTKVNGERRDMRCTLDPSLLPPVETQPETHTEPRKVNENTVAVFDIEKKDWRSFRIDSLISILQE